MMRLPTIPIDKQAHIWWGWAIAATLLPHTGAWVALLAAAAAGFAKEAWDRSGRGTYDPRDFWATSAGGACALMANSALQLITTTTTR